MSSSISAYNSCLPSLVPSYLSLNKSNADSAKLSAFSNVLPLVTIVSFLSCHDLIKGVGRGVEVIIVWGCCPSLIPNCN